MAERIVYDTLTADTVKTVTLDGNYTAVRVFNRTGLAEIFAIVDSDDPPTVEGADCTLIPAAIAAIRVRSPQVTDATTVKLISTGTDDICVEGLIE